MLNGKANSPKYSSKLAKTNFKFNVFMDLNQSRTNTSENEGMISLEILQNFSTSFRSFDVLN